MKPVFFVLGWLALSSSVLPNALQAADHSWNGSNYSSHKNIQLQGALDQIKDYSFIGNETVLDIGSGDGEITQALASHTRGTILGIDRDASMIDYATEHYGSERISFKKEDGSRIQYQEQFHLITSFNAAQWIADQPAFLKRIRQALKPGGKVLIGMPTWLSNEAIGTSLMISIFKKTTQSPRWKEYFKTYQSAWHFFSQSEYEGFLTQVGFKHSKVQITKKPFKLPNKLAFIDWMRQISPHLKYLPENLKTEFLEEVAAQYLLQVPTDTLGEVLLSHAQLEAMATR